MKTLGVGVLGFGTIGTGVIRLVREEADLMAARTGVRPEMRWVADPDTTRDRGIELGAIPHLASAEARLADSDLDVVVELIGGLEPARTLVLAAIEAGKHVVTANKALLSTHGAEIFAAARARGVRVGYEASVGGGIPIMRSIEHGFTANRNDAIHGIINGTANYILTKMDETGEPFSKVLEEAQQLGYAEADPSYDVDGHDTAHKLVLLVHLAFGEWVTLDEVFTEGIRNIDGTDLAYAREFGFRIKLLATAKRTDHGIEARVHPTMIPEDKLLANVGGNFNAVVVHGHAVGTTLHYGQGAGMLPTASAVLGDILDVARLAPGSESLVEAPRATVVPVDDLVLPYYLRFSVLDQPNVLSRLTGALGDHGISIASVVQTERSAGQPVPVVMRTHDAREGDVRAALAELAAEPFVTETPHRIRIETHLEEAS